MNNFLEAPNDNAWADAGVESPAKRIKRESDKPQFHLNDNNPNKLPASFDSREFIEDSTPQKFPGRQIASPLQPNSYDIEEPFPCASNEQGGQSCHRPEEVGLARQPPLSHKDRALDGQEICYGTIEDATLVNSQGFIGLFKSTTSPFEELYFLAGQGGSVVVHNSQGNYCGLLCHRAVKALNIITQHHSLRFQVFINVGGTTNTSSNKATVQINIYGPLHDAEDVGDLLLDQEVFLQPPSEYDVSYEYRNPQCYVTPEGNTTDIVGATDDFATYGNHTLRTVKEGGVQKTLDAIIPVTNKLASFRNPHVSDLLRTPLLEHQLDGLSFMQEREEVSYCGDNSYGGILADEPGLGKSLTTLALIAGSCSPAGTPPSFVSDKCTLVIVPTSLLVSWQEQIKTHFCPKSLSLLTFHGLHRKLSLIANSNPHIVLTTYSTLVSDWSSKESILYQRQWYRVALDEAHFIKDRSTKRFKAVCALETSRRWCLTGTPLQNKIDDLSGLFSFVRRFPFDDYGQFQMRIVRPLSRGDPEGLYVLQGALRSMMMRHTKSVLALPPRNDLDVELSLSSDEQTFYEFARDDSKLLIGTCIQQNNFTKGFHIIQSILRQRQISNHGLNLLSSSTRATLTRRWRTKGAESSGKDGELPVFCEACNIEINAGQHNGMFEYCFHLVCVKCTNGHTPEHESKRACPLCTDLDSGPKRYGPKLTSLQAWVNEIEYSGPSTKVQALLKNIKESQQNGEVDFPVKSVVFSSWVRMLHLVGIALKEANINAIHYNGTLSVSEKQKVLTDFQSGTRVTVLLMSIGSGGVGLNLTAASHVHLMEPQWNPMVETQALDRVHRLGQTRPVKTFRYIAKSTFDESIVLLQSKKLDMAELSLNSNDHSKADQMRQRLESLSAVFR